MSKLLTTREVAERLRLNPQTIRTLAQRKLLAGRKAGRQWRFPEKVVEQYEGEQSTTYSGPDNSWIEGLSKGQSRQGEQQ